MLYGRTEKLEQDSPGQLVRESLRQLARQLDERPTTKVKYLDPNGYVIVSEIGAPYVPFRAYCA